MKHDIQVAHVDANDVIVVRDFEGSEREMVVFAGVLHERYPDNLVIFLGGNSTFETMPLADLRALLEETIANREAEDA